MGSPGQPPRLSHSSWALLSSWILYYRSNEKLTTNRWCNLWHQFILTSTSKISLCATINVNRTLFSASFFLLLFWGWVGGWELIHNSVQMTKYETVNTCGQFNFEDLFTSYLCTHLHGPQQMLPFYWRAWHSCITSNYTKRSLVDKLLQPWWRFFLHPLLQAYQLLWSIVS